MTTWKDRMYCGIGEYLRSQGLDVVSVDGLDEGLNQDGCPTCGPFPADGVWLEIYYTDRNKTSKTYEYDGSFADFIASIT